MVSALDSGPSGPGSSPNRGHYICCVLGQDTYSLAVPLATQEYKWVPSTKCWGVTGDGLASHPGGVAILLVASILVPRVPRVFFFAPETSSPGHKENFFIG